MTFHLRTLGRIELSAAGGERLAARRKELALLTYVARSGPGGVRRDALAALFWSESPEANARNSLRQVLLRLRRVLGEALEADAEQVALRPGALGLDADALEAAVAGGRQEEAAALWGGDFLPDAEDAGGESFRAWLDGERARLRQRVASALEQLVGEAEARGAWGEAVRWAERWAREFPLEERPHVRWIEVLLAHGRPDDARAVHGGFVARWRGELEREPPPALLRLGERLREAPASAERAAAGPLPLFTPDLIGRGDAFAQLDAALRRVAEGGRALVRVEGDAGMGTTRLCEEFLRAAEPGRALVLRAQGYEAERHVPLATARDLLAGLRHAPGLAGAPDACLAEVAVLVPSIRERFAGLPAPTRAEPALLEALVRVVADVAEEQPVVLYVDRFPAADPGTQRILLALARRLPPCVLLILAGSTEGFESVRALAELPENGLVQRVRLPPLTAAELEAMIASMLPLPPEVRRDLAGRLRAESGGNPRLVVEMVATLVDEGHLAPDRTGSWRLDPGVGTGKLPLPASLRDAVQRRLEHLGADAALVLAAASVLPAPAAPGPLQRLSRLTTDALSDALDELIARRLLREAHPPGAGYVFGHELVRRVTYERLPLPRREAMERAAAELATGTTEPPPAARPPRRRWRAPVAATSAAAVVLLLWLLARGWPGQAADPVIVAVGTIHAAQPADSATARLLPEMLATGLAGAHGLRVVSTARMYETLSRLRQRRPTPEGMMRAARTAGATELIQGGLYRHADGTLRLQLRRIDLETGEILRSYAVQGGDAFELVDAATHRLTEHLGGTAAPRLAQITTASLPAYRFYEEGLRSYYLGDHATANRFFRAAIREDSTFAIATYYAALSEHFPESAGLMERAVRLAEHASDRERLLIRAEHAAGMDAPERLAIAETLAIRYPHEPDGPLLLGRARMWSGDFLGALPHLRRTIELDSLSLDVPGSRCRACDAYAEMGSAYHYADSLAAAERVHREWIRRQPAAPGPWIGLAFGLMADGRYDEARAAVDSAEARQPGAPLADLRGEILLREGKADSATAILAERLRSADRDTRAGALWGQVIALRMQGRLDDALRAAVEYRRLAAPDAGPATVLHAALQAQVLFEMGEHRRAAALFDSIAASDLVPQSAARNARHRAWMLTHAASAHAAAGDTARLPALADTIRRVGGLSAYARDQRLHHYVRALLLRARGDRDAAVRELRRSMFSRASGHVRANLELGRTLLQAGRPGEAAEAMETALRGPVGASGLYATHTELHELAAQAWDRAGRPDRAAPHYRWVARVWGPGDPPFRRRAGEAAERLREIEQARAPRR